MGLRFVGWLGSFAWLAALLCAGGLAWAATSEDPLERGTPRGSLRGYLEATRAGDLERAARYLDLSRIEPDSRAERGPDLAWRLKIVLDQTLWVELETLSDQPEGNPDDELPSGRDQVGEIQSAHGTVAVMVQRVPREGDGVPIWKIASSTVAEIPVLYEEFGYGPLGEWLPRGLFEVQVLEVQLWQWVALLLVTTLAFLIAWLLASAGVRLASPLIARSRSDVDDRLVAALVGPARLVLFIALVTQGSRPLGLSVPVRGVLAGMGKAGAAVAVTWFLMRLVDLLAQLLADRLEVRAEQTHQLVPLGSKVLKGVLVLLAVVATLDSFGFNVTTLVAGLGVGGIAVALAAQKTLENLFGGFMLLADRPVRVGDFCRFGDKLGIVEEIGLRSTRVRTLDRTVVSVPNAEFSAMQIENLASRDRMRLQTVIGVRYETTPGQLRRVLEELRSVLRDHPLISENPRRVRMVGFGASSLDIEVYGYVETPDWDEYLEVREQIFLQMMEAVERAGTGFAFPSQTVYLAKDDGIAELPEGGSAS